MKKSKLLWFAVIAVILLPLIAIAQDEVKLIGLDSSNNAHYVLVDSQGRIVTTSGTSSSGTAGTSTSAANVKTDTGSAIPVPVNASSCSTPGGASCTIIYGPTDWSAWPQVDIAIINSGANALTDVQVEWSPDGSNWEVWDNTTFAALSASTTKSEQLSGNSRKYLRIEARSAAGTTAQVIINANQG